MPCGTARAGTQGSASEGFVRDPGLGGTAPQLPTRASQRPQSVLVIAATIHAHSDTPFGRPPRSDEPRHITAAAHGDATDTAARWHPRRGRPAARRHPRRRGQVHEAPQRPVPQWLPPAPTAARGSADHPCKRLSPGRRARLLHEATEVGFSLGHGSEHTTARVGQQSGQFPRPGKVPRRGL